MFGAFGFMNPKSHRSDEPRLSGYPVAWRACLQAPRNTARAGIRSPVPILGGHDNLHRRTAEVLAHACPVVRNCGDLHSSTSRAAVIGSRMRPRPVPAPC